MKIIIYIAFIVISIPILAQTGDDGWNNRIIDTYENDIETARVSIIYLPGFNTESVIDFHTYIDQDIPFNGGVPVTDGEFNKNYVREFTPIHDHRTTATPSHSNLDYSQWSEIITYYDGLGRVEQKVSVKGSPVYTDVIQPVVYDDFGRLKRGYLPYSIAQDGEDGPGGFRPDVVAEQIDFYDYFYPDEQDITYSEKNFDNSPLNRVLKQASPGLDWQMNGGHEVEFKYLSNSANEVVLYEVDQNGNLNKNGFYPENTLFENVIIDENQNQTKEFVDKQGRVVQKCSYDDLQWIVTCFIYDDYGLLRYIIPPEASSIFNSSGGLPGNIYNNQTIKDYCYYNKYDDKHRMIIKKLPGADDPAFLVYNKRDQLVLTQDGNQRMNNDWLFLKYDVFNRQIMAGKYHHSASLDQDQMQNLVDVNDVFFEDVNYTFEHGYSNNAFPDISSPGCEAYTNIYYDNYDYVEQSQFNNRYAFQSGEIDFSYPLANNTKGQITVVKIKILANSEIAVGVDFLIIANYYDKYLHGIQSVSDNHLGGLDIISNKINYTGDILLTKENHNNGSEGIIVQNEFEYDNGKRLIETRHKINNESWTTLSYEKFDELGRVKRKHIHGNDDNYLQTLNYNYNIRNWLIDINDVATIGSDLFAMSLGYTSGTYPQFNGNISLMQWRSSLFSANTYNYDYDGANRLISADYSGIGSYQTSYSYDKNGNIISLTRDGMIGQSQQWSSIDVLTYTYNGNQLKTVNDIPGSSQHQNNGYSDNGYFSYSEPEYEYDTNGNMVLDENKSIQINEYNHLNLPQQLNISTSGNNAINYLYNAHGVKIRKQTKIDNLVENTVDYIGSFVYEDNGNFELRYILTANGRVMLNSDETIEYQYFLKDHLGNTRVVINENGDVVQENAYYPFGMQMNGLSFETGLNYKNKYLYNGKELQDDFGLDWYDYGARFYNPTLGRWISPDPKSEKFSKWSPFNYCLNNPVSLIDPDGREPTPNEAIALIKHINSYFSKDIELVGGWKLDKRYDYREQSGYTAGLYSRMKDDGNIEYSFVTRGSDIDFSSANIESTLKDWENNLNQLSGSTEQYKQSVEIAKKVSSSTEEELTFLGQSLGGGLASANALATGRRGITFNAVGLSDATIMDLSLNNKTTNITAWIIEGEIADYMQSITPRVNRGECNLNSV